MSAAIQQVWIDTPTAPRRPSTGTASSVKAASHTRATSGPGQALERGPSTALHERGAETTSTAPATSTGERALAQSDRLAHEQHQRHGPDEHGHSRRLGVLDRRG